MLVDSAPFFVWMSITPVVRKPNCAGSAPVMSEMLSANRVCEFLAETGNTFRQEHVIDAVLQVGMFAADMKLAE